MTTDEDAGGGVRAGRVLGNPLGRALDRFAALLSRARARVRDDGLVGTAGLCGRILERRLRERVYLPLLRARSDDGLVRYRVDDFVFYLDLDDPGLSRRLLVRGEHEPTTERLWRDAIEEGMEIVDVGANLGYYTVMAADRVGGSGHVHAIEPVPENHRILRKNVTANGFAAPNDFGEGVVSSGEPNGSGVVSTYQTAVGASDETATMYLTDESNWGTLMSWDEDERASSYMVEKMAEKTRDTADVETITLDSFVEEADVGSVDAFRMDVEGYEVEITEGMAGVLEDADAPCWAFVEVHNKLFDEHERVVGGLLETYLESGFEPYALVIGNDRIEVEDDAFVETVLSYDQACPHVVLRK